MKQPTMASMPSLINLGGLVSGGLAEFETELGLHYVDGDGFSAAMTDLIVKHGLHQAGKQVMKARTEAVQVAAGDCQVFIRKTRDVLKPTLGYDYTLNWNALGFTQGLRIPSRVALVNPMMQMIRGYLTNNPAQENAGLNVTAAQATVYFNALNAAQQALAVQKMNMRTLVTNQNAQATVTRGKIQLLKKELSAVLTPLDARWLRFGLNQPGLLRAPGAPGKVTVVLAGNNAVSVKWDAVARAEHYRIWIKVLGVDEDFRSYGSSADRDFTLENLPANAQVEVALSAVNNGGESARGESVTVIMA